MKWSYGVTTVPDRRATLLPGTLASLAAAGFDAPRLFVDGPVTDDFASYEWTGCPIVFRETSVTPFGNWILALWELYLRDPAADRFAIFQDDVVLYRNVRKYLDGCTYPRRGYWNLITFTQANETLLADRWIGWREGCLLNPPEDDPSLNQAGRGAVALVFDRLAVQTLLASPRIAVHPTDLSVPKSRPGSCPIGHRRIDGAVVEAMNAAGCREYVHGPSLAQHVGAETSIAGSPRHSLARSFRGESFDAMELAVSAAKETIHA